MTQIKIKFKKIEISSNCWTPTFDLWTKGQICIVVNCVDEPYILYISGLALHSGPFCSHLPVHHNHKLHVFLSTLCPLLPFPHLFPSLLSLSYFPQTYDDLDLENEPWYKFFSELEFGRPVSQDQSYSRNRSPAVVPYTQFIHSTQLFSPPINWVVPPVWACSTCWVL